MKSYHINPTMFDAARPLNGMGKRWRDMAQYIMPSSQHESRLSNIPRIFGEGFDGEIIFGRALRRYLRRAWPSWRVLLHVGISLTFRFSAAQI